MSTPVVLITGALSGIGRAAALAYAEQKAQLVVSGRNEQKGDSFARELRALGAEAEFVRADVRHEEDVRRLVDKTVERFGRIDVAVNNAGTEGVAKPVVEQTPESYADIFDTNVLGVLLSLKHELRVMLPKGKGSIINISSVAGRVGFPTVSVYSASKHAVEGLTKSAALEVADKGVRVNAVAPGPIQTPMLDRFTGNDENKAAFAAMIPAARLGTVDEVARLIVFLGSDQSPFMTGESISIDGGLLAK